MRTVDVFSMRRGTQTSLNNSARNHYGVRDRSELEGLGSLLRFYLLSLRKLQWWPEALFWSRPQEGS